MSPWDEKCHLAEINVQKSSELDSSAKTQRENVFMTPWRQQRAKRQSFPISSLITLSLWSLYFYNFHYDQKGKKVKKLQMEFPPSMRKLMIRNQWKGNRPRVALYIKKEKMITHSTGFAIKPGDTVQGALMRNKHQFCIYYIRVRHGIIRTDSLKSCLQLSGTLS